MRQPKGPGLHDRHHNASPINPLPPVVVALGGVIALIELAFQAGARGLAGGPAGVGWRIAAVERFGFSDRLFDYMVETATPRLDGAIRMVSYLFVHGTFTHAIFAVVLLLALGTYVSKVFPPLSVVLAFLLGGIAGAAVQGLVLDQRAALIGAYPGIYALLGLYTWLLWVAADEMGTNRYAAFRLVALLVGLQIFFGLIGAGTQGIVADIGGFVAGFALATPLAPGGLGRLRARIRGH